MTQSKEKQKKKQKTKQINKEKKMSNINKKGIQIIKFPWKIITKKQNICIKNN